RGQIFGPVTGNVSPRSWARVRHAARSEPAFGSEKPWHQTSSPVRMRRRKRCFCASVPWWMSVGPTSPGPTPMSIMCGAPSAVYSSAKMNCSIGDAPRPPYSLGQWSPAHPPSNRRRCHWRANATFSAGSSGFLNPGIPQPGGRLATSQSCTSRRKRASASLGRKSRVLLSEPAERRVVEEARIQRYATVVGRLLPGSVHAGDRGPIGLDVLGELEAHGGAPEALGRCEIGRREAQHLVDVQQIALPRELAVPGAGPRHLIDPQLDLAVEVVLVLRYPLDHPELALGDARERRRPGDTLPVGVHVAGPAIAVVLDGAPAATRELMPLGLALVAVQVHQSVAFPLTPDP